MARKMKHWGLVKHLRKWGLEVEESRGWRSRGRPYDLYPKAIFAHHTASGRLSGNFASEGTVTFGRPPSLPGPLSQFLLGRDGTVKIIAAGYCNHAGYGGPHAGIPANRGNTFGIGIEAENNGVGEPWGDAQLNAYYRLCAALMDWFGIDDINKVFGHKEWTSRKIDPNGINMDVFRKRVMDAYRAGTRKQKRDTNVVHPKNIKVGKRHYEVRYLKRALKKKGFHKARIWGNPWGNYWGPKDVEDLKRFKRSLGWAPEHINGRVNPYVLKKLGLRAK